MATSKAKTNFRDVQAEILERITKGDWGPGTLLPNEVDLAESFGCSRTTINRAMRELSDLGLVERRRKAGTRVRMTPVRQARFEIPSVRAEIEKTGARYGYQLLRRDVGAAPDWLRERLNLADGGELVHVMCLHSANGDPYQLENRWINATALPEVLSQEFRTSGPSDWLIATVPYSDVELAFLAVPADAECVAHLGYEPGEPVFRIERTTWWQGQTITHVELCHRRGHRVTTRY